MRRAHRGYGEGGHAEPVIGPAEGPTRWLCPPYARCSGRMPRATLLANRKDAVRTPDVSATARSCSHSWSHRSLSARPLPSRQAQQPTPSCLLPNALHSVPLTEPRAQCTGRDAQREPSCRHPAKRDVLKANVAPEHWSMALSPASAPQLMRGKRSQIRTAALPCDRITTSATQQRIASIDQSWCPRRGHRGIKLA